MNVAVVGAGIRANAFTDPDVAEGDELTLSIAGNSNPALVEASWNDATLVLTFFPDQNGEAHLTIRASDSYGGFAEQAFAVSVSPVNDPPVLTSAIPEIMLTADQLPANPCIPTGPLVESLLTCRNWISYSPSRPYNPEVNPQVFPDVEDIRADLQLLYEEGWRGLVTYAMDGTLGEVPRIAKEIGFAKVIAGLYWYDEAHLAQEWQAALDAVEYCDGYILGNEGLLSNPAWNTHPRYTRAELASKIEPARLF